MSSGGPLITVILPVYKNAGFLRESIESILCQTLADLELIIIDDGSPDQSWDIIQSFKDPRISAFRQENQGTGKAVRRGFDRASGRYIAFANDDDVWLPTKLERQVEVLCTDETRVVFTWLKFINEHGESVNVRDYSTTLANEPNRSRPDLLRRFFFDGNYFAAASALFAKEIITKDIHCGLNSIQCWDWFIWVDLLKQRSFHTVLEELTKYRIKSDLSNTSLDLYNGPRGAFEVVRLYERMLEGIPVNLFREAFAFDLRDKDFVGDVEFALEKAFLYLLHHWRFIQYIGAVQLHRLLYDGSVLELAERKYHFGLKDLFALTKQTDFYGFHREYELGTALRTCMADLEFARERLTAEQTETEHHRKELIRTQQLYASLEEQLNNQQRQATLALSEITAELKYYKQELAKMRDECSQLRNTELTKAKQHGHG